MNSPSSELPARPRPRPTPASQPYWDALLGGRLVFQACADCGKRRHYPRPLCDACYSRRDTWVESSGRGRVHSWTIAHHPFHLAFKSMTPYALVTVEMEEGVRVQAPWRGAVAALRLELPVTAIFERVDAELVLPAFVPAAS